MPPVIGERGASRSIRSIDTHRRMRLDRPPRSPIKRHEDGQRRVHLLGGGKGASEPRGPGAGRQLFVPRVWLPMLTPQVKWPTHKVQSCPRPPLPMNWGAGTICPECVCEGGNAASGGDAPPQASSRTLTSLWGVKGGRERRRRGGGSNRHMARGPPFFRPPPKNPPPNHLLPLDCTRYPCTLKAPAGRHHSSERHPAPLFS